jgi:hypothetical protein
MRLQLYRRRARGKRGRWSAGAGAAHRAGACGGRGRGAAGAAGGAAGRGGAGARDAAALRRGRRAGLGPRAAAPPGRPALAQPVRLRPHRAAARCGPLLQVRPTCPRAASPRCRPARAASLSSGFQACRLPGFQCEAEAVIDHLGSGLRVSSSCAAESASALTRSSNLPGPSPRRCQALETRHVSHCLLSALSTGHVRVCACCSAWSACAHNLSAGSLH